MDALKQSKVHYNNVKYIRKETEATLDFISGACDIIFLFYYEA